MERCLADPLIDVLRPWRLVGLDQDGDGVTATIESRQEQGEQKTLRASYLVGCDGANSAVRGILGIDQQGERDVTTFAQVHFRSRDLEALHTFGQFWHLFFIGGGVGAIIAQDERETWTLHTTDLGDEAEGGEIDPQALLNRICGREIAVDEFLEVSVWRPNILVADSFREGRVFLAGDAAHQVIPTGGYGLNTGIGDAIDLGWKLAAVVSGWGGEALLDSYEAERRPVAIANRDWSFRHVGVHMEAQELVDHSLLDEEGPAGEAHRKEIAEFLEVNRGENESAGIELGYSYASSPVIASDSEAPAEAASDPFRYVPSTLPGSRAPHVTLADGGSLLDRFVDGFTLVAFGAGAEEAAEPFSAAAAELGMPISVLRIDDAKAREIYERDLVLVRPDGHVAWRGAAAPGDPAAILAQVTGHLMHNV
jgi:FAD-dependent monooxygenase